MKKVWLIIFLTVLSITIYTNSLYAHGYADFWYAAINFEAGYKYNNVMVESSLNVLGLKGALQYNYRDNISLYAAITVPIEIENVDILFFPGIGYSTEYQFSGRLKFNTYLSDSLYVATALDINSEKVMPSLSLGWRF